jgi:tetratricopeptide (TPR) repeat protein
MSQNSENILIDHLDNLLSGISLPETDELIRSDKNIAKEWHCLLYAVDGIREAGLYEQVSAVRKQYQTQQSFMSKPAGGIVRSIYRNAFRVAACLFLLVGAAAIYKYNTVSSGSVYNDYYSSFELNTSRSSEAEGPIEQAFRDKKWEEVISLSEVSGPKPIKAEFLNAMANMELKKYEKAIDAFKQVIAANEKSGDSYFQDEAEYYLAMSYLANNKAAEALPILKKIKSDKNHIYNAKVKNMSALDLKILDYKSDK